MLPTIERIARAIPKSAIEITAITLLIAAIWYAFEISTFSSLSESQARFWLRISEWLIFVSALVLAIGLILEWPESESWKKLLVYKAAKWAVLIGVVGELLGDGGVSQAGDRVTELQDRTIMQLLTHRTLSQDQKDRLASVAKRFPAQLPNPDSRRQ